MKVEIDRSALRCPYCHQEVDVALAWKACDVCLARHHMACWDELARCATCGGRSALERPTERGPSRAWSSSAFIMASAVVGLGLGVPVGLLCLHRAPVRAETKNAASRRITDPDAAPVTFEVQHVPPTPLPEAPVVQPLPMPATPVAPPARNPVECRALRIGFDPAHFALTHDGKYLLLASRETDRVVVWDWDRDEEEKRIPVEGGPCFIFVRGSKAYVCNGKVATISVIDLRTLAVCDTFKLPAGQPCSMSAAADRSSPAFVCCGQTQGAHRLVRLDLATGKSSLVTGDQGGWGFFTVHSAGKLATWQGDACNRWLYEVGSGGTLTFLGYRPDIATGALYPDRRGKYWLGAGTVWDAALTKQVAKLDSATMLVEHSTDPVLVGIDLGQPDNNREGQHGTITLYDATSFTAVFSHAFTLPPAADGQNSAGYPYGVGWSSRPVVVSGSSGTVAMFRFRANVVKLTVPPEAYTPRTTTRLSKPFPRTTAAGLSWSFKLEVQDAKTAPTFKAIEIPPGCELDTGTGELTWECPTSGDHDFVIRVVTGGDDFLIEERLKVESR